MNRLTPLPYGRHTIEDDDIAAVAAVLRGDWLTTGPMVEAFEAEFASAVGASYAVACATGTAALHLAVLAAGLGPGDQAIVPAVTFVATANALRFCGADVVFADVDSVDGLMGVAELDEAGRRADPSRLKAVLPVHLGGQSADPAGIAAWAAARGAVVIEDACHAVGSRYVSASGESRIGECRDSLAACFSLHPVKTVTMGEGGVVTTGSARLAAEMRRYRGHGITRNPADYINQELAWDSDGQPNPWYYEMPDPAPNYRASDIACALGLAQMRKLERFVQARLDLVAAYDAALAALAPVIRPVRRRPMARVGWHLYQVLVDFPAIGMSRATFMRELLRRGVGSQVHYIPVHRQPYYRRLYGDVVLPGADRYYDATLSLPLFPSMAKSDVEFVVSHLADVVSQGRPTGAERTT